MSARAQLDIALGFECAWPNPYAPLPVRSPRCGAWWRKLRVGAEIALLALGAWQFGQGAWIEAKAWLAQALIGRAWAKTLAGHRNVKPWPWADTWPVARLSVPALGIERYVLAGTSGAAMAFGPGHVEGTAYAPCLSAPLAGRLRNPSRVAGRCASQLHRAPRDGAGQARYLDR